MMTSTPSILRHYYVSFFFQEIKCKKYWPDENKIEKFGNIYVKFDYQEVFADFILTNLVVTKVGIKDIRFIYRQQRDLITMC